MRHDYLIKQINDEDYFHTQSYKAFVDKLSAEEKTKFADLKERLWDDIISEFDLRKIVHYALQNKLNSLYKNGIDFKSAETLSLKEIEFIYSELFSIFIPDQVLTVLEIFELTIIRHKVIENNLELVKQLIDKSTKVSEFETGKKHVRDSDRRFAISSDSEVKPDTPYGKYPPNKVKNKLTIFQKNTEETLNFLESFSSFFPDEIPAPTLRMLCRDVRGAVNRVCDLVKKYDSSVESTAEAIFYFLVDLFYKSNTSKIQRKFQSKYDFINHLGFLFQLTSTTEEDTGSMPIIMEEESIRKRIQQGRTYFENLGGYFNDDEVEKLLKLKNKIESKI